MKSTQRRITMAVLAVLVLTLLILAGNRPVKSQSKSSFTGFDLVDKSGNIRKPQDTRDLYQLLGTYLVADSKAEEMHVTYASPGAAQYYRKNGKFADGTVLVKETFATDHAQMTTGDARWATNTKVWFVMIKDDKNRFPNNPLWGVMDGDGRSSTPTHPISSSQPGTKRTASVVMFRLSQPTGYTCRGTRSSNRNSQTSLSETHSEKPSEGELQCKSIC